MSRTRVRPSRAGVCSRCGRSFVTVSVTACPECGGPVVGVRQPRIRWLSLPPMRYPNAYVWFVFLSALDIMLTWLILGLSGVELNPIANAVVAHVGLPGMVGFKFGLVILVVVMAEVIGRGRDRVGRKLAEWAVAITAIPVALALWQLLW